MDILFLDNLPREATATSYHIRARTGNVICSFQDYAEAAMVCISLNVKSIRADLGISNRFLVGAEMDKIALCGTNGVTRAPWEINRLIESAYCDVRTNDGETRRQMYILDGPTVSLGKRITSSTPGVAAAPLPRACDGIIAAPSAPRRTAAPPTRGPAPAPLPAPAPAPASPPATSTATVTAAQLRGFVRRGLPDDQPPLIQAAVADGTQQAAGSAEMDTESGDDETLVLVADP